MKKSLMRQRKDLTGLEFGLLKVIQLDHIDKCRNSKWLCKCNCGNIKIIRGDSLTLGNTKSCGCLSLNRNIIKSSNNIAYIHLNGKNGEGKTAIIDSEFIPVVNGHSWHLSVRKNGTHKAVNSSKITLHKLIIGSCDPDSYIDHINGDVLDNRKSNLRICSNAQNQWNQRKIHPDKTSRFKGVSRHKSTKKWIAFISVNGKNKNLGLFESEEDAATAYDIEASKYRNKYACTNKMLNLL